MKILDDRILLRKPEPSDLEALYNLKNDEYSNSMLVGFNNGYSKEDIKNWITFHNNAQNEVLYLIVELESNEVMGHVGLYNIDYRVRKADYAILIANEKYRGKGYGQLCTSYMLNYAFNKLNINKVELSLLSKNKKALNLYKKNGFVMEGLVKQTQYKNGEYLDLILMSKFRN